MHITPEPEKPPLTLRGVIAKVKAACVTARDSVFLRRWWKEVVVLLALLITLAAPYLLKPAESTAPSRYDRRIVILTPHNEKIRHEFGLAFARHWKQKTGETLYVDWRVAGTSELALMLRSDYTAAFELYWTKKLGREWTPVVAAAFLGGKPKPTSTSAAPGTGEAELARKEFLDSEVGIGVDLFFGGGSFDFEQQAKAGVLVAADVLGDHGLKAVFAEHPEWFQPNSIPQMVSGEAFYDKEKRWVGTCLSSMGIVFNRDVLERLGIEKEPTQWADLADPRYAGQIALSDPNKSGTVTKALEQLIQQQIHLAIDEVRKKPGDLKTEKAIVDAGLARGWERGLRLIQRICANARYFTDGATKIPLEVAQGDAAAGMCVDFYGRSFEEQCRKPDGSTRVSFVAPKGGASISVDPVGLLRGAPQPKVATEFMRFVLSDAGQRIWNFQVGVQGGPVAAALRRLPVRQDFYTEENRRWMTDGSAQPFEDAKAFVYHPEWTGSLFNVIRFLVKVMCIDVHDEQQHAWAMLAQTDFPPKATRSFENMALVTYQSAVELAASLSRKDKELEVKLAREMSANFRSQYELAYTFAKGSQ
jgi:iron(III) transport system substrate-binding protein